MNKVPNYFLPCPLHGIIDANQSPKCTCCMASAKSPEATLSIDMLEDNPYIPGSRRTDVQRSLCVGRPRPVLDHALSFTIESRTTTSKSSCGWQHRGAECKFRIAKSQHDCGARPLDIGHLDSCDFECKFAGVDATDFPFDTGHGHN